MKVTGLALVPPPAAADLPKVTPELLASVLARYSRSNQGIHAILEKVDLANPDASIDRILNFVDYGHASIGGLTGGLAIAIDDVSMWHAYKIFEIAQMADGQESSTRYITMAATNLPAPEELGIPADLASRWSDVMAKSFAAYNAGRGSVKKWVERYGDPRDPKVDAVDWVERIPFSETRNYVQRVLENVQVYRARFGGGSRLQIEADLHRGASIE